MGSLASLKADSRPFEMRNGGGKTQPLIAEQHLMRLILDPKPLPADWQTDLLTQGESDNKYDRRRVYLNHDVTVGPARGSYYLFRRTSKSDPDGDWSVGIAFVDLTGNRYRLVRCNAAAGHRNIIENEILTVSPHVHYVTERYLRDPRRSEDGYAVTTDSFHDANSALAHLVSVANLYVPGRLWTVDA